MGYEYGGEIIVSGVEIVCDVGDGIWGEEYESEFFPFSSDGEFSALEVDLISIEVAEF